MIRVGVLTVSDRGFRGESDDLSGSIIREWCEEQGFSVERTAIVPDGTSSVVPPLLEWCDSGDIELLVTTGGTGFTPRDVTPEATEAVAERPAMGLAEALRRAGEASTPFAVISRGLVAIRGGCIIVNLPGSPGGVRDGLQALEPFVKHLTALVREGSDPHPPRSGS